MIPRRKTNSVAAQEGASLSDNFKLPRFMVQSLLDPFATARIFVDGHNFIALRELLAAAATLFRLGEFLIHGGILA